MLAQKKDTELKIIKGLHNHDSGHKINNIYTKHNDKPVNMGHCHTCNGPHLIKDCNESTYGRCKPNLDKYTQSKCPRKHPFNKQLNPNPFNNTDNTGRNKLNNYNEPNLKLYISTNKTDHMTELLEASKKMTKYFKSIANLTLMKISTATPVHIPIATPTQTGTKPNHTIVVMS